MSSVRTRMYACIQRGWGGGQNTHQLPEVAVGLNQTLQALHEVLLVDGRVVDGEVALLTEQIAAEDVKPAGEGTGGGQRKEGH